MIEVLGDEEMRYLKGYYKSFVNCDFLRGTKSQYSKRFGKIEVL